MSVCAPYQCITTELYLPRGAAPLDQSEMPSWPFSCGGGYGVNLARTSMRNGLDDLDGRFEPIFLEERTKVTYRLLIDGPGREVFSRQMNAQYTRNGGRYPIPRFKVVEQVAQVVNAFIRKEERQMNSEQYYRFGAGYLTLDQLYLMEVRQVSMASYQIILGIIAPPPVPTFSSHLIEGFETFDLDVRW